MDVLTLTNVDSKRYHQYIESIDSTMKTFSTVAMKYTLRYLEDKILDAIVHSATGF